MHLMRQRFLQTILSLGLIHAAQAQNLSGGTVNFNSLPCSFVPVPIYDTDQKTRLASADYQAQLYAGPAGTAESALSAVGAPTPFITTGIFGSGGFSGGERVIPRVGAGQKAAVQVRAWKASSGSSWESATIRGQSAVFEVVTGGGLPPAPPAPPACLGGLKSFSLQTASGTSSADDFADGNDHGWRRYDVLAAVGGTPATFEVKDGAYHMRAPLSPKPAVLGPPRAGGFFPSTEFTDFTVSVDVLNWDDQAGTMFGVLGRVHNIGIGTSSGYYFRYCSNCRNVEIDYVRNEQGFVLARRELTLNPAKDYRFVFTGIGEYLRGDLYELENLAVPIVTLTALDNRFSSGLSGLLIANFSLREADATFDNYVAKAAEGEIPGYATSIRRAGDGATTILFKGNPGTSYEIQASDVLGSGQWTTLGSRKAGPDRRFEFLDMGAAVKAMRIYRLQKLSL